MKLLILLPVLLLTGCANQGFVTDIVGDGTHTVSCAYVEYNGSVTNSRLNGQRIRFPEGFDVSQVTPEQLETYIKLLCRS